MALQSAIYFDDFNGNAWCWFQGEWYSIQKDTDSFYDLTGFADYRLVSEAGYSLDDYNKIKNIDGVNELARYLAIKTNEAKENDVISLTVT